MPAVAAGSVIAVVLGLWADMPGGDDFVALGAGGLAYSLGVMARERMME